MGEVRKRNIASFGISMKVNILGVKIDDIKMDEALDQIAGWLSRKGKHYIVTPNPEILMAAQKDGRFRKILNDADLSIPDGAGLKLSGKVKNTLPGTDLMEELLKLAAEKGFTAGFLGGRGDVAKETAECLSEKYPNLKISYAGSGGLIDENGNSENLTTNYQLPATDILFVAFGHIKQEKWMANHLDKVPVHVMMGVGGAFDYLSGRVSRAPEWIRKLGFEWLFRLVMQPWRIARQLALFKYLWLLQKHTRI